MPCPDNNTIAELVCRQLDPGEMSEVEEHIADCTLCRRLVAALAVSSLPRLAASAIGTEPSASTRIVLRRGSKIGRYEVVDLLGAGGMGVVYSAHDPELDRLVALKLLHPKLATDPATARSLLLAEAQAMAKLRHDNVVAVYDAGMHGELVFVAMELVDGETLRDWLLVRRSWREVVRVLAAAGRGLVAAHALDIVHRDFKPANVLLGPKGQVCVSDFGLARQAGVGAEVAGTVTYMAPEQFAGQPPDPRADQYSFCVVLWEALYGSRPPGDESSTVQEVRTRPPSAAERANRRVPARLRRIAQRGLHADPAARFASMAELVAAMEPRRRRWPIFVGGAAISGAAALAVVIAARPDGATCTGAEAHLQGVWDSARRDAVSEAFARSKLPYAADASRSASASLDGYAARWTETHARACEAGQRGETSPDALDLRMQCLDHRLDELRALTNLFVDADAGVVARAARAAAALPATESCLDLDSAITRVRPPSDPAQRAEVESLHDSLATAHAQLASGRYEAALATLTPLAERARTVGHPPILAEILLALGRARTEMAAPTDEAVDLLGEAARTAYAANHDEIAARAWIALVYAAVERADVKAALAAVDLAKAALARVPKADPIWRAQLLSYEGIVHYTKGDYGTALDKHQQALAAAKQALPAGHDRFATFLNNISNAHRKLGQRTEALALIREAVAIREKTLGVAHPDTAENRGNLALQLAGLNRHAEALVEFDRAIEALEKSVGPRHALLGPVLTSSCTSLERTGRIEEALVRARRAVAIFEETSGKDHPTTATATTQVASLLVATKRIDEARVLYERALTIQEKNLGPDHPNLATTLNNLGFALVEAKHPRAAIPHFERALAIVENKLGPKHPRVAYSVVGLGQAHLDAGDAARAVPFLLRALELFEQAEAGPGELGEVRFTLARALWQANTDRRGATALAAKAIEDFAAAKDDEQRKKVEQWWRGHGGNR